MNCSSSPSVPTSKTNRWGRSAPVPATWKSCLPTASSFPSPTTAHSPLCFATTSAAMLFHAASFVARARVTASSSARVRIRTRRRSAPRGVPSRSGAAAGRGGFTRTSTAAAAAPSAATGHFASNARRTSPRGGCLRAAPRRPTAPRVAPSSRGADSRRASARRVGESSGVCMERLLFAAPQVVEAARLAAVHGRDADPQHAGDLVGAPLEADPEPQHEARVLPEAAHRLRPRRRGLCVGLRRRRDPRRAARAAAPSARPAAGPRPRSARSGTATARTGRPTAAPAADATPSGTPCAARPRRPRGGGAARAGPSRPAARTRRRARRTPPGRPVRAASTV